VLPGARSNRKCVILSCRLRILGIDDAVLIRFPYPEPPLDFAAGIFSHWAVARRKQGAVEGLRENRGSAVSPPVLTRTLEGVRGSPRIYAGGGAL
jgi:hypothetical protein